MTAKLLKKVFNAIPDFALKNKFMCYFMNKFKQHRFKSAYISGHFEHHFDNGILLKSYEKIFYSLTVLLDGYLGRYTIKKGDVIVDCGATNGDFAIYAAMAAGDKGVVYAFEPDRVNYERLLRNIDLNGVKNIRAVNKGIWSRSGALKMDLGRGFVSLSESRAGDDGQAVDVVSLDEALADKRVDFIKMDIEGAEIEAVKGARKILSGNDVNMAIASYHVVSGMMSSVQLERLLKEYGYAAETSFEPHPTTYARKMDAR